MKLLASGCTKDAVLHYAEEVAASDDGNVKTNAETVISICLNVNKDLGKQLKEDNDMNVTEVVSGIFAIAEKAGVKKGRQDGVNQTNERVARDMLKKELPLSLIEEISKLSEDTIRSLAKSLGVSVS